MSVRFVVEDGGVAVSKAAGAIGTEPDYMVIDLATAEVETDNKTYAVAKGYADILNKLPVEASEVAHAFTGYSGGKCEICEGLKTWVIHDKKWRE